jgi:hypothetical protein
MARKLTKAVLAERRRHQVGRLYLQGRSLQQIADAVGAHLHTVHRDLKTMRDAWRESAAASIQRRLDRELAKIDLIEVEAWDAWELSKAEEVTEYTELAQPEAAAPGTAAKPGSRKTGRRKSNRLPSAEFMQTIRWCVDTRLKLMGAFPKGSGPGDPSDAPGGTVLLIDRERAVMGIRGAPEAELAALGAFYGRLGVSKPPAPGQPVVLEGEATDAPGD